MQIIFQDPFASLNPRMTVGAIARRGLDDPRSRRGSRERRSAVDELLERVGLSAEHIDRYPHEFSGGQRQRIGIARALALEPRVHRRRRAGLGARCLDPGADHQPARRTCSSEFGLTMLFIAHDLAVVEYICDRIIVLYLGRVMEIGPGERSSRRPQHPYTRGAAFRRPGRRSGRADVERIVLKGDIPSPATRPRAASSARAAPIAIDDCAEVVPPLREIAPGHFKACIRDDVA